MVKFLSLQWNTATFSVLTVHIESNSLEKKRFFKKAKKVKKNSKKPPKHSQLIHCTKIFFNVFNNLEFHYASILWLDVVAAPYPAWPGTSSAGPPQLQISTIGPKNLHLSALSSSWDTKQTDPLGAQQFQRCFSFSNCRIITELFSVWSLLDTSPTPQCPVWAGKKPKLTQASTSPSWAWLSQHVHFSDTVAKNVWPGNSAIP